MESKIIFTCVTRFGLCSGHHPLYDRKHLKSVLASRGQIDEGVRFRCGPNIPIHLAVLDQLVGVGGLVIALSEPRQLDGGRVDEGHGEFPDCFGH